MLLGRNTLETQLNLLAICSRNQRFGVESKRVSWGAVIASRDRKAKLAG